MRYCVAILFVLLSCKRKEDANFSEQTKIINDNKIYIGSEKYNALRNDKSLNFRTTDAEDVLIKYGDKAHKTLNYTVGGSKNTFVYYFLLAGTDSVLPYYTIIEDTIDFDFYEIFQSKDSYEAYKSLRKVTITFDKQLVENKNITFKKIPLVQYRKAFN